MAYRKEQTPSCEENEPLFDSESSLVPGIRIREVKAVELARKTNIPGYDYVINPYIGCSNKCSYCYAAYMGEFDPHPDPWGAYIDVRLTDEPLSAAKLTGKKIFLSSVTDPYNAAEKHYELMRKILDQLSHIECSIQISTKTDLVLRDLDLLKQQDDICVDVSLNTLNEQFREDMDCGVSVNRRLDVLKQLHDEGIKTGIFVSPIFPELTDPEMIVEATHEFVDMYMFEDLQLRYPYKEGVLKYIRGKHPHIYDVYQSIYIDKDLSYWTLVEKEAEEACLKYGKEFIDAFHHSKRKSPRNLSEDPFGGDSLFK